MPTLKRGQIPKVFLYCVLLQEVRFMTVPISSLSAEHGCNMGKLLTAGQTATNRLLRITVGTADQRGQSEARSKG